MPKGAKSYGFGGKGSGIPKGAQGKKGKPRGRKGKGSKGY